MSVYRDEAGRQRMEAWYARFLDGLSAPVETRRVPTPVGETHVLLTGPVDAPVLLCFHGVMGSAPSALSLIEPLVSNFRIVFPDTVGQPGRSAETLLPLRGRAYADWAMAVMDALGLGRVGLLGVSMGGYIALKLAAAEPDRVRALSLWVPGGIVNGRLVDSIPLALQSLGLYLWPSERRLQSFYDTLFTERDDTWLSFYGDSVSCLRLDRRMPELAADGAFDELSAPVQLFGNGQDVLFPSRPLLQRAEALFPNLVDTAVFEDFRHVPPFTLERVGPILDRIRRFQLDAAEG